MPGLKRPSARAGRGPFGPPARAPIAKSTRADVALRMAEREQLLLSLLGAAERYVGDLAAEAGITHCQAKFSLDALAERGVLRRRLRASPTSGLGRVHYQVRAMIRPEERGCP